MNKNIDLAVFVSAFLLLLLVPNYGVLAAFLVIIIYLLIGRERKLKFNSIGFRDPGSIIKLILLTLLFGIIIELSFQIIFNPLIEMITNSRVDLSGLENVKGNLTNYIILLLVGWIIGGFIEEIVFRGFLLTRIAGIFKDSAFGVTTAIIITSAVFGYLHSYQGWSGMISTGLIGAIFGIIFIKYNRIIWYSILTHGFVNMTGITILYLDLTDNLRNILFSF